MKPNGFCVSAAVDDFQPAVLHSAIPVHLLVQEHQVVHDHDDQHHAACGQYQRRHVWDAWGPQPAAHTHGQR